MKITAFKSHYVLKYEAERPEKGLGSEKCAVLLQKTWIWVPALTLGSSRVLSFLFSPPWVRLMYCKYAHIQNKNKGIIETWRESFMGIFVKHLTVVKRWITENNFLRLKLSKNELFLCSSPKYCCRITYNTKMAWINFLTIFGLNFSLKLNLIIY